MVYSDKMDSLADNLVALLPLLHGTVINLDDFNTDSDLGRAHYEIVAFLQAAEKEVTKEGPPMSVICKSLNISKPYMTNLIDRLIKKEYVERVPDTDDRRIIRIKLTDLGRALISEHFLLMRSSAKTKLACLSMNEVDEFLSALQIVTAKLGKVRETIKKDK